MFLSSDVCAGVYMTKSTEKQFPKAQSLEKFSQNTENVPSHYSARIYFVIIFSQDIELIKCGRLSLLDTELYIIGTWGETLLSNTHLNRRKGLKAT